MVHSTIEGKNFRAYIYKHIKMASWEPVDINHDEISDEDVKWDDNVMKDPESRFEELR